jgi:hypothetical protein
MLPPKMVYGILCDSYVLQQWQVAIISALHENQIEPVLIIMPTSTYETKPSFIQKAINYPYKNLLFRVYYRYFLSPSAKKPQSIEPFLKGCKHLRCTTTNKGISEYFNQTDVEAINASGAQFLLRFGFGIIKGGILESVPYGVWSFHHDDPEAVRGVPSNFWEILEGHHTNGAILQRLTSKIDAGLVLKQGWFATVSHSWKANIDQAYWGTIEWPLAICKQLMDGKGLIGNQQVNIVPSPMRFAPTNSTMIKMLGKMWINKLAFHFKELFLTEKWQIGLINKPYADVLMKKAALRADSFLKGTSKAHYKADPHLFAYKNANFVVYEDYDYHDRHGRIFLQELDESLSPKHQAYKTIERPYHLAFPFVFEHDGNAYCVPENSLGNSLDLYQFDAGTKSFAFKHTLIKDICAIDPIIFHYASKWWLLCTDKKSTNTLLNIWFADDLIGTWQPHLLNPVKTDIRSARPAGPVCMVDGRLIRPAQDCAKHSGHRISVMEIETLTPTQFSEKLLHTLELPSNGAIKGLHTLSGNGNLTAFDQKHHVFVWANFWHQFKRKLHL